MIGDYVARVRRNHALEHATVSLLIGRVGPDIRVVGRASGDGFFLYGDIPSDVLGECVREGLDRLKRGEAFWAVTPHCGTNLATAGVLAALASTAAMGNGDRKGKMGSAIIASMLAMIVAQPVGRMIQRHVTTSPDLADTEVVAIEERSNGRFYKVRTRRRAAPTAE